jgi:hypothetical protein
MNRNIIVPAALALLAMQVQAHAQTAAAPAPQVTTTMPSPQAPAAAPGTAAPESRPRYRQTMQQRFDAANTSKDGHLTKEQAEAAKWTYVTRHFDAIDKSHEGFVTVADIRGYARAQRAARQPASAPKNG